MFSPLLFFMSFTFFVLCCETVYTEIYQRSKLSDFLMLFVNVDQSEKKILSLQLRLAQADLGRIFYFRKKSCKMFQGFFSFLTPCLTKLKLLFFPELILLYNLTFTLIFCKVSPPLILLAHVTASRLNGSNQQRENHYYSHFGGWLTIQAWWRFPICNPLYHPSFLP